MMTASPSLGSLQSVSAKPARGRCQLFPKLILAQAEKNQARLRELDRALRAFYESANSAGYWETSHELNRAWTEATHPAHWLLKRFIEPTETIVDFGCGSAHPILNLGHPERYTGVDYSAAQNRLNQTAFPRARFLSENICETSLSSDSYDWAISLFSLEHCVWPPRLLDEMLRVVRPGGRLAIICPQMRPQVTNAMWFGLSARQSFWRKLDDGALLDAVLHGFGLKILAPIWIRLIQRYRGNFLIIERPRCLFIEPREWTPDTDAVYWADQGDIEEFLQSRGCRVLDDAPWRGGAAGGVVCCLAQKQS